MMRLLPFILLLLVACGSRKDDGASDCSAEQQQYNTLTHSELLEKGINCMSQCNYDSAVSYYSAIITDYTNNVTDTVTAGCKVTALNNTALIYLSYYYDFSKAYACLLEAENIATQYNVRGMLGVIYINMAVAAYYDNLTESRFNPEVKTYIDKAVDLAFADDDERAKICAMTSLFDITTETHDTTGVAAALSRFRAKPLSDDAYLHDYILRECEGMDAYLAGDYAVAAQRFMDATANVQSDVMPEQNMIGALCSAAEIYMQCGRRKEAEEALREALRLSEMPESHMFTLSILQRHLKLYRIFGDSAKENEFKYRYLTLKDSLINASKIGVIHDTKFQYQIDNADRQIKALNEKRHEQKTILVVVLIVAFALLALLIIFLFSYSLSRRNYRVLYQHNKDVMELENSRGEKSECRDESSTHRSQQNKLSPEDTAEIYNRVVELFDTSPEIYKQGFTAKRLSEMLQLPTRYVSQAINDHTGSNFNTLLNKYRITEACRILSNREEYGDMTIDSVAEAVGMRSRSGFSTIFKAFTGMSPSVYQAMSKEQKDDKM